MFSFKIRIKTEKLISLMIRNKILIIAKPIIARIKRSNVGHRMMRGAFWSFTGNALAKVITLVAGIVCAHILTKEEYGEYGMVYSTINMFVVFGSAGLGVTATKYIAEYKVICKKKAGSIYLLTNRFAFLTGFLTTLVVLFMADYLSSVTLKAPHLANCIRIGALMLFVTIMNGAQNGVLLGFEDFRSRAINTLLGSAAESFFLLVGAYYFGVFGAVLGYGMGYLVLYFCNFFSIKKGLKANGFTRDDLHVKKEDFPILYTFSIPAALSSILVGPAFWVSRTFLVQENGFTELAIYEAANYWNAIILFIPAAVTQIVLPILTSIPKDNSAQFWKVLKVNLYLNTGVAFILALVASLLSPFLMASYGKGYSDHFAVLIILVFSTVFCVASTVVGNSIISTGKMWFGFLFNIMWSLLFVTFSWLFINKGFGAIGISYAMLIAYVLHTIYQFIYLRMIK